MLQAQKMAAEETIQNSFAYENAVYERFAELIIAKCIEEASEPADGLIKGDTWHDGVRASIWSIQQYFTE